MSDTPETMWEGRFLRMRRAGPWEYVERTRGIEAVVIVAIDDGHLLLVEQQRVPLEQRCLELPAGLVGDDSAGETIETAAIRELEEEAGYRADRIKRLGLFASSPGLTSERFELVLATGLTRTGDGGGVDGEGIAVHRVALAEVPAFIADRRREGIAIDVKLLIFLAGGILA